MPNWAWLAAFDLHNVFGVVDFILHALVEGAIDGEGVLRRIVAVEIGSQQNEPGPPVRVAGGKLDAMAPPMECPAMYQWRISGN